MKPIKDAPHVGAFYSGIGDRGINPAEHPCFQLRCTGSNAGGEYSFYLTAQWSGGQRGFDVPPAIGTRVRVTVNSIGPGVVDGYFVEAGYLGVRVKLDPETRAEWHKKQNPDIDYALVFGSEIARIP